MREPIQNLIELYQRNLYIVAFNVCKNPEDAEDIVQDTFVKYYQTDKEFDSLEHIRAWLIRVAINKAKNNVMSFWKRSNAALEDYVETLTFENEESHELFEEVMKLPEKYRIVVHLFYFEDYSVREIADILRLSESNVKARLKRARDELKKKLKEAWEDEQ